MKTFLALLVLMAPGPQDDRAPVPDADAQRKAEKVIREVYGTEHLKKPPADRITFARKLIQQGIESKDDPASQYVMFREARDTAARAGDVGAAFQAIDEMARRFQTDVAASKFVALSLIVQEGRLDALKPAAESYLKLAEDAAIGGDFDTAEKSAAAAVAAARKAKDVSLVGRTEARSKELAEIKARAARVKKARDTLAANPNDPAANLEVGQFECFVKGNWDAGLPFLAKGPEESLRTLVQQDLAGADSSQNQLALADGWWSRSEKEAGLPRQKIRERAAHWYGLASREATGLTRVRIERRLDELGRKAEPAAPSKEAGSGLLGWWKLDEGSGATLQDSSGRNHPGSISRQGEWTDGRVVKALRFRGKESQVTIPDAEELRLSGDLTVAVWFRLDGRSSDWVRLVGKGLAATRNYGLWVEREPGNRILFQQGESPTTHTSVFGTTTASLGTWVHLAGVVEGSTLTLYVNGKKEGSVQRSVPPPISSEPVTLGFAGFHEGFIGLLDDVRIYNRALGEPEIQGLASPK